MSFDNWLAMWRLATRGHLGASTVGIQPLDIDSSHGWQILATQPWAPRWQGREVGTHHNGKISGKMGKKGIKEPSYNQTMVQKCQNLKLIQPTENHSLHTTHANPTYTWEPAVIPSPQKPTFLNYNSIQNAWAFNTRASGNYSSCLIWFDFDMLHEVTTDLRDPSSFANITYILTACKARILWFSVPCPTPLVSLIWCVVFFYLQAGLTLSAHCTFLKSGLVMWPQWSQSFWHQCHMTGSAK